MVGLDAFVRRGVGIADGRHPVLHGDPVGARIGAEVGVERAVLLHDDHDVADLVDPVAEGRPRLVPMARELGRREQQTEEEDGSDADEEEPLQGERDAMPRS